MRSKHASKSPVYLLKLTRFICKSSVIFDKNISPTKLLSYLGRTVKDWTALWETHEHWNNLCLVKIVQLSLTVWAACWICSSLNIHSLSSSILLSAWWAECFEIHKQTHLVWGWVWLMENSKEEVWRKESEICYVSNVRLIVPLDRLSLLTSRSPALCNSTPPSGPFTLEVVTIFPLLIEVLTVFFKVLLYPTQASIISSFIKKSTPLHKLS